MEISETQLLAFVTRILELAESEQTKKKMKEQQCVIFSDVWSEKYPLFFQSCIRSGKEYDWVGIVSKEQLDDSRYMKVLTEYCSQIVLQEEAFAQQLYQIQGVYPVLARDILAKAALIIPDCFEVKWMQRMLEEGSRIEVWMSGLEPFTGKEPKAYQERITSYIRTLLEYGIEIETDK